MRIAVIGQIKSFGCGSVAYRLAEVLEKDHVIFRVPTQALSSQNEEGQRRIYYVSEFLGEDVHDLILVTQSQILLYNDTGIPLILYKQERVDPQGTVENPNFTLKKLEVVEDIVNYQNIVFPVIDLNRYDPNREKELILSDMEWVPQEFEAYIDIMERSQHAIIFQRIHETDCTTVRVLEAMACKTIPIIFYRTNYLRRLYAMMGINETNAYFVCTGRPYNVEIKKYDVEMANRGYKLVHQYFGTEVLAAKILDVYNKYLIKNIEVIQHRKK